MERLNRRRMGNVLVVAGGIIPEDDISSLREIGIKAIFGPGTPTSEIVASIQRLIRERG
jgi:methylmalonyl-CoA mutase C-terminal domain/subunit